MSSSYSYGEDLNDVKCILDYDRFVKVEINTNTVKYI